MSPAGRSTQPRGRTWRRYAGLGAALAGLGIIVIAFDRSPTARAVRSQLWSLNSLHYGEFDRKLPARPATAWYVGVGPGELLPEAAPPLMQPAGAIFNAPVEVNIT